LIQLKNTESKPLSFPSLDCLDDLGSDRLIMPFAKITKLKTPTQVEAYLTSIKHMRSIKTAVQAEELLLMLTSACLQNDQWVSCLLSSKSHTDVSRTPHTDFDYLID
jgi:hypothetical protein